MTLYRKKPVVVEARQFPEVPPKPMFSQAEAQFMADVTELSIWCQGRERFLYAVPYICIDTLEGTMRAYPGDWIIKGVNGEFYPCKPDIFEKTYEPVDQEEK